MDSDDVMEDIVDGESWICQGDCDDVFFGPDELAYYSTVGPICVDCAFD